MTDSIHILFIEDEILGARVLSTALKRKFKNKYEIDAEIDIEHSLGDGIDTLRNRDYDLILTDLNLPDSLGVDTVLALRSAAGQTPIIPITGYCPNTKGLIQPFIKTGEMSVLVERIYNEITNKRADLEMRKLLCAKELMAVFSRREELAYGT